MKLYEARHAAMLHATVFLSGSILKRRDKIQEQSLIIFSLLRQGFCRAQREICLTYENVASISFLSFSISSQTDTEILFSEGSRLQVLKLRKGKRYTYSSEELRNVRALRKLETEEKKDLQMCQLSFIFPRSFS